MGRWSQSAPAASASCSLRAQTVRAGAGHCRSAPPWRSSRPRIVVAIQPSQGEVSMKRTTKQTQGPDRRPAGERIALATADLAQVTGGDVYLHTPRGSNNASGGG